MDKHIPSSQQASSTFEPVSRSVEETQQLGARLGACLAAGDVVGLRGDLGSGKTTFIQGLAHGLGIEPSSVKSRTFVLLREYPGRVPLIHLDGYRLERPDAARELDVDWIFSPTKVTVLEWSERFAGCLPDDYLEITLTHKTTNQRALRATAHGPRSATLLQSWQAALKPDATA